MSELPIIKRCAMRHVDTSHITIGELRKIPAGKFFRSIALQMNIASDRDVVFEVTNICLGSEFVFGDIQTIFYGPYIAGRSKSVNCQLSINYPETEPYQMPKGILEK